MIENYQKLFNKPTLDSNWQAEWVEKIQPSDEEKKAQRESINDLSAQNNFIQLFEQTSENKNETEISFKAGTNKKLFDLLNYIHKSMPFPDAIMNNIAVFLSPVSETSQENIEAIKNKIDPTRTATSSLFPK